MVVGAEAGSEEVKVALGEEALSLPLHSVTVCRGAGGVEAVAAKREADGAPTRVQAALRGVRRRPRGEGSPRP